MAAVIVQRYRQRRQIRRNRIFRDGLNPVERFDDRDLINKFRFPRFIILQITVPTQAQADQQKQLFHSIAGFPGVFACIDGTHVRLQRPRNNVQIVCNADLLIMDCVARHPGSAHDARVLRESALFAGMERQPPLVNGLILGDSEYPIRDWLITPFGQPANVQEERLNLAHRETRATVERCIGVLKRRFYCLHMELRVEPHVASRIVYACCMLHNRATQLGLEAPEDEPAPPAGNIPLPNPGVPNVAGERARTAAGKAMRLHIARTHFQ